MILPVNSTATDRADVVARARTNPAAHKTPMGCVA